MSINILISYPSEKLAEAQEVYSFLVSLGVSVWFDRESLVAGDDWNSEIEHAIVRADLIVLLSSKATLSRSGVLQRELNRILELQRDRPIGSNYIVNLRAEELDLPRELTRFQWIDMFEPGWRRHLSRAVDKKIRQLALETPPQLASVLSAFGRATDSRRHSIDVRDAEREFSSTFYTYDIAGPYWEYVNSEICALIYADYYSARRQFGVYDRDRPMIWSIESEEYFRQGELISLRFSWFYDAGGVHPNHGWRTLNFAGQDHGKISVEGLFGFDEGTRQRIKTFIERDIRHKFESLGESADFEFSEPLEGAEAWQPYRDFSFNERGLTFNLSPYAILAYAFGSHQVFIPWQFFRGSFSDEFQNGPLADLVSAIDL